MEWASGLLVTIFFLQDVPPYFGVLLQDVNTIMLATPDILRLSDVTQILTVIVEPIAIDIRHLSPTDMVDDETLRAVPDESLSDEVMK